MKVALITKYIFRIRTRNGVIVENLAIYGRSEDEASRKLRQIYNDCEILGCQLMQASPTGRSGTMNYEDVVDLIVEA
jgi:hypothetical protein